MNLRLKRTPGLYVVGFMASGKSTVGKHLADQLGWSFFDIDHEIENDAKTPVAQLLDQRGEEEFRRIESGIVHQHVRWIERGRPAVLAIGEGAFAQQANRDMLMNHGMAIWLDCPLHVVKRRVEDTLQGALARDPERLAEIFDARREAYAKADIHVPIVSDDPAVTVRAILAHVLLK